MDGFVCLELIWEYGWDEVCVIDDLDIYVIINDKLGFDFVILYFYLLLLWMNFYWFVLMIDFFVWEWDVGLDWDLGFIKKRVSFELVCFFNFMFWWRCCWGEI